MSSLCSPHRTSLCLKKAVASSIAPALLWALIAPSRPFFLVTWNLEEWMSIALNNSKDAGRILKNPKAFFPVEPCSAWVGKSGATRSAGHSLLCCQEMPASFSPLDKIRIEWFKWHYWYDNDFPYFPDTPLSILCEHSCSALLTVPSNLIPRTNSSHGAGYNTRTSSLPVPTPSLVPGPSAGQFRKWRLRICTW